MAVPPSKSISVIIVDDHRMVRIGLAAFLRGGTGDIGLLHFGRNGSWRLALAPDTDEG